jgi:hypothetical protein
MLVPRSSADMHLATSEGILSLSVGAGVGAHGTERAPGALGYGRKAMDRINRAVRRQKGQRLAVLV